jgi:hypothetical protein
MLRRIRLVAVCALMAVVASSCFYLDAVIAENETEPVPWFCNPTAFNTVVNPAMGTVDWYAGITRAPLSYSDCKTLGAQLDLAQAFANQFPTRGDAEAAGYFETFERIPGMGTHHGLGVLTAADFADPTFDPVHPEERLNSGLPGHVDGKFEPGRPEFLQYDGTSPSSPLVGMSYYVYTDTGLPPEGFVGDNDWWHHHPRLCHDPATGKATLGVNLSDTACGNRGGVNVHLENFYMLHVWIVPNVELHADVHAPTHPCIKAGSTIFDMNDPCHDELPPAGAPVPGSSDAGLAVPTGLFCPIGLVGQDWEPTDA